MKKIDFKKELKEFYGPKAGKVVEVQLPAMNFLMVDGQGDPNTGDQFGPAVEALYALSYALKFMIKKGQQQLDYGVMPLEGLWWADDMSKFSVDDKSSWKWTAMIMQPDPVTNELVADATEQVRKKKNPAALSLVRFERFTEGRAFQTLHIGPFENEGPAIEAVHRQIDENGGLLSGKHHEIYLSDIRKAAPEKWRTVIRQPFA
jgi:hypothetical protein